MVARCCCGEANCKRQEKLLHLMAVEFFHPKHEQKLPEFVSSIYAVHL